MKRALFALSFALAACGGGCGGESIESADNHGYGWEFDAVGSNGLRLRRAGATTRDADRLEARAAVVVLCVGVTPPAWPFVIVVPSGTFPPPISGRYESHPPLILLQASELNPRFEHEVVHYLLDVSTGNLDPQHASAVWGRCAT